MGGWLDRPNVRVRGVVFDLDGTLVDSYAAIAASLNAARESFGLEPLPEADVRKRVGSKPSWPTSSGRRMPRPGS